MKHDSKLIKQKSSLQLNRTGSVLMITQVNDYVNGNHDYCWIAQLLNHCLMVGNIHRHRRQPNDTNLQRLVN